MNDHETGLRTAVRALDEAITDKARTTARRRLCELDVAMTQGVVYRPTEEPCSQPDCTVCQTGPEAFCLIGLVIPDEDLEKHADQNIIRYGIQDKVFKDPNNTTQSPFFVPWDDAATVLGVERAKAIVKEELCGPEAAP